MSFPTRNNPPLSLRFKCMLILALALITSACAKLEEFPLILPVASEPSATLHNERGIAEFKKGNYLEASLHFNQALTADRTTGEIHFNMGLALHMRGEHDRAREHLREAVKYAKGDEKILNSALVKSYLGPEP